MEGISFPSTEQGLEDIKSKKHQKLATQGSNQKLSKIWITSQTQEACSQFKFVWAWGVCCDSNHHKEDPDNLDQTIIKIFTHLPTTWVWGVIEFIVKYSTWPKSAIRGEWKCTTKACYVPPCHQILSIDGYYPYPVMEYVQGTLFLAGYSNYWGKGWPPWTIHVTGEDSKWW